jgi:hypothetical protein
VTLKILDSYLLLCAHPSLRFNGTLSLCPLPAKSPPAPTSLPQIIPANAAAMPQSAVTSPKRSSPDPNPDAPKGPDDGCRTALDALSELCDSIARSESPTTRLHDEEAGKPASARPTHAEGVADHKNQVHQRRRSRHTHRQQQSRGGTSPGGGAGGRQGTPTCSRMPPSPRTECTTTSTGGWVCLSLM